jgi:hypothetical protein
MATTTTTTTSANSTTTTTKPTLSDRAGLEEDDEFEEFEDQDWQVQPEQEQQDWKNDWDDEMTDADFITQLRQELAKTDTSSSSTTSANNNNQHKDKLSKRS